MNGHGAAWRDVHRRGTGCSLRLGLRLDIEVSVIGRIVTMKWCEKPSSRPGRTDAAPPELHPRRLQGLRRVISRRLGYSSRCR